MNVDATASRLASEGVAFAPQIAAAAGRHGLDPDLLAAVAAQETGGPGSNAGRNVVGDGGHGHGLFQIDDRSHAFAQSAAAMDPAKNADYAAGMLSGLLARYGGDPRQALSAYNSGSPTEPGTRTRWSDGANLSYADSVMRHYRQLTGEATPGGAPDSTAPESLVSELGELISTLGALSSQAQMLPLSAPTLPGLSQQPQSYHRQATDYSQLFDDDTAS